MKYRKDFVTNSSSVAYVCEITGRADGGRDEEVSMSDLGFVECQNGHVFDMGLTLSSKEGILAGLNSRLESMKKVNCEEKRELVEGLIRDVQNDSIDLDSIYDYRNPFGCNGVPVELCPICQMAKIRDKDMIKYLLDKLGMTRDDVVNEMTDIYMSYDEMVNDLGK